MPSTRILFIAPPTNVTQQVTPDLGIGFLLSVLRENLFGVDFIDVSRDQLSNEKITQKVRDNDYLMVGVKVFSASISEANEIISAVKDGNPKTTIVIGGPHPTFAPEEALISCPQADIGIIGEAEKTIVELAQSLEKGVSIDAMESICFRKNGSVKINPKRTQIGLDDLLLPAWDLMDPRLYSRFENPWFFSRGGTIANISVSRGSPFNRTFRADFMLADKEVRYRKIKDLVEEIERLKTVYGVDEFHFTDSIFTFNKKYTYSFAEAIIRKGLNIHWATPYGTRLDTLDAPLLRAMEESGCYGISVGIETGSPRIMEFIKKGITVEKVEEKIKLIKETTKFLVHGLFVLGYPTETDETMQETIDLACRLPLDTALFAPFRLTPGTEVAEYIKQNELSPGRGDETIYTPRGISIEELEQWNRKAHRAFYMRPHIMWNLLKMIKGKKQVALLVAKLRNQVFRKAKRP